MAAALVSASIRAVIYCVVPEVLAPELYDKLAKYYEDDPNVTVIVDRRKSERRVPGSGGGGLREVRDRRRPRVTGDFPPTPGGVTARRARVTAGPASSCTSTAAPAGTPGRPPRPPWSRRPTARCSTRPGSLSATRRTTSPSTAGCCSGSSARRRSAPTEVDVVNDSELVANQINGRYKVKHPGSQAAARGGLGGPALLRPLDDPLGAAGGERGRRPRSSTRRSIARR